MYKINIEKIASEYMMTEYLNWFSISWKDGTLFLDYFLGGEQYLKKDMTNTEVGC